MENLEDLKIIDCKERDYELKRRITTIANVMTNNVISKTPDFLGMYIRLLGTMDIPENDENKTLFRIPKLLEGITFLLKNLLMISTFYVIRRIIFGFDFFKFIGNWEILIYVFFSILISFFISKFQGQFLRGLIERDNLIVNENNSIHESRNNRKKKLKEHNSI